MYNVSSLLIPPNIQRHDTSYRNSHASAKECQHRHFHSTVLFTEYSHAYGLFQDKLLVFLPLYM